MTRQAGLRSQGAFLGIVLLLLVACGGGSASTQAPQAGGSANPQTTAAAGATPNAAVTTAPTTAAGGGQTAGACTLATMAEVSAAYGFTVASATPSADANYSGCAYASADGSQKVNTFISISAQGAQYMNTVKINAGSPVSGVGDEAFWSTEPSGPPGIFFTKHGVLVYLSGSSSGPEDLVVALAKTVAGRV